MIIVVEGHDNSGKTTLGAQIAKAIRAVYIKAERPSAGPDLLVYHSILREAQRYSGHVVADRHVAISEPIYGPICRGSHDLNQGDIALCLGDIGLLIYCRPPDDVILKTMGDRPQMDGVIDHAPEILKAYDSFFIGFNLAREQRFIKYDYQQGVPSNEWWKHYVNSLR